MLRGAEKKTSTHCNEYMPMDAVQWMHASGNLQELEVGLVHFNLVKPGRGFCMSSGVGCRFHAWLEQ